MADPMICIPTAANMDRNNALAVLPTLIVNVALQDCLSLAKRL